MSRSRSRHGKSSRKSSSRKQRRRSEDGSDEGYSLKRPDPPPSKKRHRSGNGNATNSHRRREQPSPKKKKRRKEGDGKRGSKTNGGRKDDDWRMLEASGRDRGRDRARKDYEKNHPFPVIKDESGLTLAFGGSAVKQEELDREAFNTNTDPKPEPTVDGDEGEEVIEKELPCYVPSGVLDEPDQLKKKGVIIKYHEPPEAQKPKSKWVWFVYKNDKEVKKYWLHRKSMQLIGRDIRVCDIKIHHPTISKQHAVLQYRYRILKGKPSVYPYLLDMGGKHGTFINNKRMVAKKYYQLLPKDIVKFGNSTRKYVTMCRDMIDYKKLHTEENDSDSDKSEKSDDGGLEW